MSKTSFDYTAPSSKKNYVIKNFYSVCVDDFFTNPNDIRNFGLNLKKEPDAEGKWPGKRSFILHDIDEKFANELILKVFSTYIDLKYTSVSWKESQVMFQEISPFKNDVINKGWIHQDTGMQLAFVIYLTPDADPNSGTSLFRIKKEVQKSFYHKRHYEKEQLLKGENVNVNEYNKAISDNEDLFEETTKFSNVYNRMIAYDSNEFHRANSFVTNSENRLTIVGFINGIEMEEMPLERVRKIENNR